MNKKNLIASVLLTNPMQIYAASEQNHSTFITDEQLYCAQPKTWNLDCNKSIGCHDRKQIYSSNIESFTREESRELSPESKSKFLAACDMDIPSNEQLVLLYLSCGIANLESKNYFSAFADYQKALDALGNSSNNAIEFLVLFGMIVACDHLNLTDCCSNNILKIRTLLDLSDDGEESLEYRTPKDDGISNYLKALAGTSPSVEIQDILLSFISEIFPFSSASYSFSAECIHASLPSYGGPFMTQPCRSFWGRLEKLGHNIRRVCEKILDIIERCLDIRDRIQGNPNERQIGQINQEFIQLNDF